MTPSKNVFSIDSKSPDPSVIQRAAGIISSGGVVIFPTQGLYGIGANALDPASVDRVFRIKDRPPEKPVLVLIANISDLESLVRTVPPDARRIIDACWPGGVTVVLHAASHLPINLTAGTGKIGIRLPLHPVARELVRLAGIPVTGTSANLSGQTGCANIADIDPRVRHQVDMVLDAGSLSGGAGSTIVDATVTPPKILREGYVSRKRILDAISGG